MVELTRRAAVILGAALMAGEAAAPRPAGIRLPDEAIEGGPLDSPASVASRCWWSTPPASAATPAICRAAEAARKYGPRGLVVLGVPSQDFNQESSDNKKIKDFCDANYNVDFPMTTVSPCPRRRRRRRSTPSWRSAAAGRRAGTSTSTWSAATAGRCAASRPRPGRFPRAGPGDRGGAGGTRGLTLRRRPYRRGEAGASFAPHDLLRSGRVGPCPRRLHRRRLRQGRGWLRPADGDPRPARAHPPAARGHGADAGAHPGDQYLAIPGRPGAGPGAAEALAFLAAAVLGTLAGAGILARSDAALLSGLLGLLLIGSAALALAGRPMPTPSPAQERWLRRWSAARPGC